MYTVDESTFNQAKDQLKLYELEFGEGIKAVRGDSKFFGMEVGNSVMILQLWNNDFCTASFQIPDAHIICCNGKYTVVSSDTVIAEPNSEFRDPLNPYIASKDNRDTVLLKDTADLSNEEPIGEASIEDRLSNIYAADADDDIEIKAPINPAPKPRETILEAAKDAVQVKMPNEKPVITRGKQKPEEVKDEPQREVVKRNKPEYQKPVESKPRPVYKPEPEPEKPVSAFGNW